MSVKVDAPELARAFSNALIFMPARNKVPFAYIDVGPTEVVTAGSHDDYVIGTDVVAVESFTGDPTKAWRGLVTAADLTALERAAREAKRVTATIEVEWGSLTMTPMGLEPVTVVNHAAGIDNGKWLDQYAMLLSMLSEVENEERRSKTALSRGFFSKFDKVKTDNKDHPLSITIPDEYSPWFVKCGPTFRGMVAPVDENVYEANNGQEGLW